MRWLKEGSIFKVYNSRFTSSSHTTVAQQISSWIVNELESGNGHLLVIVYAIQTRRIFV